MICEFSVNKQPQPDAKWQFFGLFHHLLKQWDFFHGFCQTLTALKYPNMTPYLKPGDTIVPRPKKILGYEFSATKPTSGPNKLAWNFLPKPLDSFYQMTQVEVEIKHFGGFLSRIYHYRPAFHNGISTIPASLPSVQHEDPLSQSTQFDYCFSDGLVQPHSVALKNTTCPRDVKKYLQAPRPTASRPRGLNDSDRQIEGLEMRLVDVPTDQEGKLEVYLKKWWV